MVSLVTFVSELSLVAIGVLGLRYERNWLFYFALTSGAIGSAVWVVQFQGARTVWAGPWDIMLVPCTIGIAAITRTRMRAARGLAFDRELWSAVDDVSKLL